MSILQCTIVYHEDQVWSVVDEDGLGDTSGGQCRAQRGGQPDDVLAGPEPAAITARDLLSMNANR